MTTTQPATELQPRFSTDGASPTPWTEGRTQLEDAEVFWLTTVRPDGRPHVTPLIAIWLDDCLYFCTGATERKAKNLARNPHCVITTGCNRLEGLDIVVEGAANRTRHEPTLQRLAALWASKYDWHYAVSEGAFHGERGNVAHVYQVTPTTIFGFGKGKIASQTRWRFLGADAA